jgi:hypothetical protein
LKPDDVVVGWGRFTPAVLAAEAAPCPAWIDLRGEVGRRLGRKAGGTGPACEAFGAPSDEPWAPGRGGRGAAEGRHRKPGSAGVRGCLDREGYRCASHGTHAHRFHKLPELAELTELTELSAKRTDLTLPKLTEPLVDTPASITAVPRPSGVARKRCLGWTAHRGDYLRSSESRWNAQSSR